MTFNEIETALGRRLEGTDGIPCIAWPNKHFEPDGMYVEFRHAPNGRIDDTIDAIGAYQFGLALITVVAPENEFANEANELAQKIADRFPKALRLSAGAGNVVINAATVPVSPFPDGAYWRQPLTVSYITEE